MNQIYKYERYMMNAQFFTLVINKYEQLSVFDRRIVNWHNNYLRLKFDYRLYINLIYDLAKQVSTLYLNVRHNIGSCKYCNMQR